MRGEVPERGFGAFLWRGVVRRLVRVVRFLHRFQLEHKTVQRVGFIIELNLGSEDEPTPPPSPFKLHIPV